MKIHHRTSGYLLKICGITNPTTAYQTAQLGADFIGIIFDSKSIRSTNIQQAIAIAAAVRSGGCEAVAVCVDEDFNTILELCTATQIRIIQLHGNNARTQQKFLAEKFRCIYVIEIDRYGAICNEDLSGIHLLNPEKDFLLLDYKKGEKNITADLSQGIAIAKGQHLPFFVSGGINPHNAQSLLDKYHPCGIDVASGVESVPGIKDLRLISKMIQLVNNGG